MSSVTVRQNVATFTSVDGLTIDTDALLELTVVDEDPASSIAYKVVCIPIGQDNETTCWVDAETFAELKKAKDAIDIYLLNKMADALG